MKEIVILALCVVAVQCVSRRNRPDFDCEGACRRFGYDPKCSTENQSFDNECFVRCKWHYTDCDGRCPCRKEPEPQKFVYYTRPCGCSLDIEPVCASDNEDYRNKCEAECAGKIVWYDGYCY